MNADLGGDDVMLVQYSVLFAKPGAEAILQSSREEVVAYTTDESSFAGLKVAEFPELVQQQGIPWPSAWKVRPSDQYPEVGQPIRRIPEQDRKFIRLNYNLIWRRHNSDNEDDKRKIDALSKIRDELEGVERDPENKTGHEIDNCDK